MTSTNSKTTSSHWIARGFAALLVSALLATPGLAQDASEPLAIVRETLDQVLVILAKTELSAQERAREVEELTAHRFDLTTISRLVLARRWKGFSPEQREEFVEEFGTMLTRSYGARITSYEQERIAILDHRFEPRGDLTVLTRVVGGTADGIEIDYRLRKNDDLWQVIDVIIEGISLVSSYRSQFAEILSRGGPDELLGMLREKNAASAEGARSEAQPSEVQKEDAEGARSEAQPSEVQKEDAEGARSEP
jgi:phospholipid transport system substrate-binding protein